MANLCDGVAAHNQKQLTNSRAFCEGLNARIASNAAEANPHEVGSDANKAYTAGYNTAALEAGVGPVDKADAPCCAFPLSTVPA